MPENPLLSITFHIPFDRVRAEHVEPGIRELIARSQSNIDRIVQDSAPRSFANTMRALENSTENLDYALAIVRHLESVATTPELRAAWNAVEPEASAFYSRIPLNEGLWKQLQSYSATSDARALKGTKQRLLTKTLDSFRRHGAELDPAGKKRMAEIDVELAKATTKFSENVLDSTNAFELIVTDESKLSGLPPGAIAMARQSAEAKKIYGWRFTLQAPSYVPVLTYLDDREIREKMYRAFTARATEAQRDNRPLLKRILELRREKAELLGFPDFADFVLHDRMAHKGNRAMKFIEELKAKTDPFFAKENAALQAFAKEDAFAGRTLESWDVGYWSEKQRRALYDFDEEQLRPYFPAERVVEGMFTIVERLYGIKVQQKSGVPVWHPDVRYYEVHDRDDALLGAFYADWFPRESKRDGAWMEGFITGSFVSDNRFEPHAGCICGNLTPPIGDKPALLTHREVETIFHEFGHLLHHVLSRVEVRSLSGTSVAWDFVELPSQIMENWCWEREALDLFARHYQTGEAIPEDLFRKMVRARTYRGANAQMRQLGFGFVDLKLHREYDPARDGDVVTYARNVLQQFSPAKFPENYAMIAAFTHLFASPVGYGAGYYSYKWAEVLDADAFTRFLDEGIFSPNVGGAFREHILSKGDSEDPAELYRKFMGREPDPDALLLRSGLVA
ncbi:MAG TPA: M3 family metallopeptidase [Bryobacteraceae bacterium]|jgi:oligopeptidase A|nr:M3 family metallopeptidase [Bryobacteraceae bacterium]